MTAAVTERVAAGRQQRRAAGASRRGEAQHLRFCLLVRVSEKNGMPAPPHSAMQALTASLTVRPASQSAPRANRSRAPAAARQARSSSFAAGAVSLSALTQATRSVSVSASRSSPVTTSMAHGEEKAKQIFLGVDTLSETDVRLSPTYTEMARMVWAMYRSPPPHAG